MKKNYRDEPISLNMEADKIISAAKAVNPNPRLRREMYFAVHNKELLALLDQTQDVEGLYPELTCFEWIDKTFFDALFRKTKDVSSYLKVALRFEHDTDYLISRSTDFKGCFKDMLDSSVPYSKLNTVLANATDVEGCLLEMLDDYDRYSYFLYGSFHTLVAKTVDFEGCLETALRKGFVDGDFIEALIEKTTKLDGFLFLALRTSSVTLGVVKKLVERNGTYPACLRDALCEVERKGTLEELFDLFIDGNMDFSGCLLKAIERKVDPKHLSRLVEKTTDFRWCLDAAVCEIPNQPKILEVLIDKTEDTSDAFELALSRDKSVFYRPHEKELRAEFYEEFCVEYSRDIAREIEVDVVYKLFAKAKNVGNICISYALNSAMAYSGEFFTELFRKNEGHEEGFLEYALGNKNVTPESLEIILTKATNFKGCLKAALGCGRDLEIIERLLLKTTDFAGCLEAALKNGSYTTEFYERLLALTPGGVTGVHVENALRGNSPVEFVEKLLNLVDTPGASLGIAILRGYPADLLRKIYEKTTRFDNCFWYIVRSNTTNVPLDLMLKLLGKTYTITEEFYEKGTHSLEFMRAVLKRRMGLTWGCILRVIKRGIYPFEFISEMMESCCSGFREVGQLVDAGCPVDFIERHIEGYKVTDGTFGTLLNHGGFSIDFLVKLAEKTPRKHGRKALELAIEKGYPSVLLDVLLGKGGRIDRVESLDETPLPPEYKKYYNVFHDNDECFVCLLDFEDSTVDNVQALSCGHKVHSACVKNQPLDFKCPYH